MEHRVFRAMGTDIELLVDADEAGRQLDAAAAEFERLEELLSRFRESSELSHLNCHGSLQAGPDLRRVVELALAARDRTCGRFDPTVHDALVAAGYDRTFDEIGDAAVPAGAPRPAGGGVTITDAAIVLDEGVHLDLGGIGKGYAAERAAEILAVAGPCLVNAGGDIAVRGGRWPIGVQTADGSLTLELSGGGLATSGRDRRVWSRNGRELHHLIDPRTGAPANSDLVRVTVVADDAVDAEVAAKDLFFAGAEEASQSELAAVLVTEGGRTVLTGPLR
jgi:FAD:protein FMN transferase